MASLVEKVFHLIPAPDKSGLLATIEKELRAASEIVVATDAGREGEMIAWEIIEHAKASAPVRRFWTSALTENAVQNAAANLLPGSRKLPLYHAALARSRADWIEGLSYTRYFTRHHTSPHAKPLSVGRVQTAMAALVEERCHEVASFVAHSYFEIEAVLGTRHGPLKLRHCPPPDRRLHDRRASAAASGAAVYSLTAAGQSAIQKGDPLLGGMMLCYARREIVKIASYTAPDELLGVKVSRVSYAYKLRDIASWAKTSPVQNAFPQIKEGLSRPDRTDTGGVVLTSDGWVDEHMIW